MPASRANGQRQGRNSTAYKARTLIVSCTMHMHISRPTWCRPYFACLQGVVSYFSFYISLDAPLTVCLVCSATFNVRNPVCACGHVFAERSLDSRRVQKGSHEESPVETAVRKKEEKRALEDDNQLLQRKTPRVLH
jgi:hypothetical protein